MLSVVGPSTSLWVAGASFRGSGKGYPALQALLPCGRRPSLLVATVSSKPFKSLHQQGLQELYCSDQANVRDTQRYENAHLSIR
jgi:hypothetical protein